MTAATFILMYKKPADAAASAEALKFFAWAYAKGDEMADELIYIPMPDSVVKDVEAMWAKRHRRRRRQAGLSRRCNPRLTVGVRARPRGRARTRQPLPGTSSVAGPICHFAAHRL